MSRPTSQVPAETLRDYATLEYILIGDLRDLLEEEPDETNRKWLYAVLDTLLDALPNQFALQDQGGGYLSEVLEEYPSWYGQVQALHAEQQVLYAKLAQLRSQLAREVPFPSIAEEIRHDLRDWITRLTAFHRHERRLLQSAFTVEVGTGD